MEQLIKGVVSLSRKMPVEEAYEQAEQKQLRLYGARRYPDFKAFWKKNAHYFPGSQKKKPSLIQRLGWGQNGD